MVQKNNCRIRHNDFPISKSERGLCKIIKNVNENTISEMSSKLEAVFEVMLTRRTVV